MTLPQIWNALYQGDVPSPGRKTFEGPAAFAELRAWKAERKARREEADRKARFEDHKTRRKARLGF